MSNLPLSNQIEQLEAERERIKLLLVEYKADSKPKEDIDELQTRLNRVITVIGNLRHAGKSI